MALVRATAAGTVKNGMTQYFEILNSEGATSTTMGLYPQYVSWATWLTNVKQLSSTVANVGLKGYNAYFTVSQCSKTSVCTTYYIREMFDEYLLANIGYTPGNFGFECMYTSNGSPLSYTFRQQAGTDGITCRTFSVVYKNNAIYLSVRSVTYKQNLAAYTFPIRVNTYEIRRPNYTYWGDNNEILRIEPNKFEAAKGRFKLTDKWMQRVNGGGYQTADRLTAWRRPTLDLIFTQNSTESRVSYGYNNVYQADEQPRSLYYSTGQTQIPSQTVFEAAIR
jgi:hypothetical protein